MIDFELITSLLPTFGQAALRSLALMVVATCGGLVLGFGLNAMRVLGGPAVRCGVMVWTSVWRFTPFLTQLFIVYFGLPTVGVSMSPFQAAALTLALYSACYFAEIFRGCWDTVPKGQLEAAVSAGIGRWQVFRAIEMPQALVISVPLLVNQTILVLKESALASVITYPELTMATGRVVAERFAYVEPYLLLAGTYWLMTLAIGAAGRQLTHRFGTRSRNAT